MCVSLSKTMEMGVGYNILSLVMELLRVVNCWEREKQISKDFSPVSQPQSRGPEFLGKNI